MKEYSKNEDIPEKPSAYRDRNRSRSPCSGEKDYVNVAHMIYDYKTVRGGSAEERAKLKLNV